jgi:hypothetical protein
MGNNAYTTFMNRNILFLFLLLSAGITLLVGFKQVQPKEDQQHMFIVVEGGGKKLRVHISQESGYKQETIVAENRYDYTHVLLVIDKYQKEGWQIRESNYSKSSAADPGFVADQFNVLYFRLAR